MAVHAEPRLELVELRPELVEEAVGVLARGMRANPVHVAAFGPDPDRRVRILYRMFNDLFRVFQDWDAVCARQSAARSSVRRRGPSTLMCRRETSTPCFSPSRTSAPVIKSISVGLCASTSSSIDG